MVFALSILILTFLIVDNSNPRTPKGIIRILYLEPITKMDGEENAVASQETTTEETAAVSENTSAEVETTDSQEEVVSAEVSDRPEWLPENFKRPEDLAKSYSELQTKLGNHKATEEKALLLDKILENPELITQPNRQQQQPVQPQVQRDKFGRREVSQDELQKFTFEDTRNLLREDMKAMLAPYEPVREGWAKQQTDAQTKAQVDQIYKTYPDVKENQALEDLMAGNIARGIPVDEAYKGAKEALTKELETLRESIKKETAEAKSKGGDVSSSGAVGNNRKARTIQEAAEIAKSKIGK